MDTLSIVKVAVDNGVRTSSFTDEEGSKLVELWVEVSKISS
jgi:DNA-binding MurR/RpiR family transcriptional regulator